MDALPTPVGQSGDRGLAVQFAEPAGQVAPLYVAVGAGDRPPRDKPQQDRLTVQHAAGRTHHRVFEVQQAQIVFPALSNHDPLAALSRVGDEAAHLRVDLALKMAGEGADPDRSAIFFGPDTGRGQVAQGLAGTGARFRQHHMGVAFDLPRREGGGDRPGIVALPGTLFGAGSEQECQSGPRLRFADRMCGGRGYRRPFLPFRKPLPYFEGFLRGGRILPHQCGRDIGRPTPAGFTHIGCQPGGISIDQCVAGLPKIAQHSRREVRQQGGFTLQPGCPGLQVEREREATDCRCRGARGVDEGEKLQQIERGRRA